ncbi:uncharacterized protein [Physcomitrium patens]|nr:uncharacterized protein LOC112282989 [Physcomitrium patens]PNR53850.1 hypothetical protein PHYPA_007525 [Physcomitrium patens]|eukprot:XP_024377027.1 uncharacterized protein LOC112282989 [Physcomitrella patens]
MARRSCVCGICESVNLPSVCSACINYRLLERYKLLKNLAQGRDFLRQRLDEKLIAKREAELQQHWRVEHAERRAQLKERLRQCKEDFIQGKMKRDLMQHDLDAQVRFLSAASAQVATKRLELLAHFYPDLIRAQSLVHTAVASDLYQKRRMVIRQLCKILPLRRSSMTVEERQKWEGSCSGPQSVRICGARLPLGDDPLTTPHMELAASLGYMVQLVSLAARYISGPLLHSSGFAASSSRVWQRSSYFDSRPASRSEEFPLFIPRKGGCTSSGDDNELSKSVGSTLGFSSMESPRIDTVESTASLVNYGTSSGTRESYPDVQKGIKLLRRSVGCLCAYGFGQLSLSVPTDMSIFDAFAELLNILSSKETRSRSSRGNQQPNGKFGLSEGPLARMRSGLGGMSDPNRFSPGSLSQRTPKGKVTSWNGFYDVSTESEFMEAGPNSSDSTVDGWNLVEHPRLPPPPSNSEDVEHWTRAMFIDATK